MNSLLKKNIRHEYLRITNMPQKLLNIIFFFYNRLQATPVNRLHLHGTDLNKTLTRFSSSLSIISMALRPGWLSFSSNILHYASSCISLCLLEATQLPDGPSQKGCMEGQPKDHLSAAFPASPRVPAVMGNVPVTVIKLITFQKSNLKYFIMKKSFKKVRLTEWPRCLAQYE